MIEDMNINYIFKYLLLICLIISCQANGGIYFYRNKYTNKVAYVGKTNNFVRRHKEHTRNNRFFANEKYRMDKYNTDTNIDYKESYYIKKYRPSGNILGK